jgi:hypothetical protein
MKTLNMKQIGYQQASFSDSIKSLARQVHETLPNFDEEVSDEVKAELNAGYQLRVAENQPKIDQHFIVESGNYLPVEKLAFDNHKGEKYHRTVANIMAYTPQAFGALRQSNPQLHAVIKSERDSVSKYCSNRLADLKKAIHAIKNEGVARVRGATKSFAETVKDTMDGLKKKCANAKARGDDSANEKQLVLAVSEFNRKWLAK